MALRGNLETLAAAEVLQFLTQSGKTGTLQVNEGEQCKLLSFAHGQLIYAVHQHRLPPINEVLFQRGMLSREEFAAQRERDLFDKEMTKAQERRRAGSGGEFSHVKSRLGKIMVKQGRLRQEDLDLVLEPENIPDKFLERILFQHGSVSLARMLEVRQEVDADVSLFQALLNREISTREEVETAIACAPEQTLAELLAFHGYLKKAEATFCADQLELLRGYEKPTLRLGDYLLAKGMVTTRQLEKALGEQLSRQRVLGEILVELGMVDQEAINIAEAEMAHLRFEFSPFHALNQVLTEQYGLTLPELETAHAEHLQSDRHLVDLLVELGTVDSNQVFEAIREVLAVELCDLILWTEGSYEFFEGFSLEDAMQNDAVSRIHEFTIDVGSILLDAHYRADELNRTSFKEIKRETILVSADAESLGANEAELTEWDRRLLAQIDGCRPVSDVCRTLPGNTMTDRCRMQVYLENGWAYALTREDAWVDGQACVAAGEFKQAVLFFDHARVTAGREPEDIAIRLAIQDARMSMEQAWLRRTLMSMRKGMRYFLRATRLQKVIDWVQRRQIVSGAVRWWSGVFGRWRTAAAHKSLRWSMVFEDFLIKRGLARQWWGLKSRYIQPVRRAMRTPVARVVMLFMVVGSVGFAMMVPGVPQMDNRKFEWDPTRGRGNLPLGRGPRSMSPAIARFVADGPIEARPLVRNGSVFFTSRDGCVRKLALDQTAKAAWETSVGEFGDILSSPLVLDQGIFVNNVRGTTTALDASGQIVWQKKFPRLEAIAPTPLYGAASEDPHEAGALQGIAVVSREAVIVLDPASGVELYRTTTCNRVFTAPVAGAGLLFVGSADNHVYCADWKNKQLVWDQPVDDDVRFLLFAGKTLLALVRGNSLLALDSKTGRLLWRRDLDGKPVRDIEMQGASRVCVTTTVGGLTVFSLVNGEDLSAFRPHPSLDVVRIRRRSGRYTYVSENGFIGQLDASGANLWRCAKSLGQIAEWHQDGAHLAVANKAGALDLFALPIDLPRLRPQGSAPAASPAAPAVPVGKQRIPTPPDGVPLTGDNPGGQSQRGAK